ncbi:hypothetical protein ACXYTJ_07345 [Gilvimarinus sp. F26214L]|uniref:hypothetical protein n=1 Tax=Gilvimarinus sp. DZF01 TaxID=3461371 RepID=UPI004045DD7D
MVNEASRRHYLHALGIESYVPRFVLPGAAESPILPDEPEVTPVPAESGPEPVAANQARVVSEAASATGTKPSPVAEILGPEPDKKKARPQSEPGVPRGTQHRFQLGAWRIDSDVVVLDSRQPRAALPVESLLSNIRAALGFGGTPLAPPEQLRWPHGESMNIPLEQSVVDARAMVHAYLAAQYEKQPFRTVLLMGGSATRHGLAATDSEGAIADAGGWNGKAMAALLGRSFELDLGGAIAVCAIPLPSLANLLQKPELKGRVWQAIRHLKAD